MIIGLVNNVIFTVDQHTERKKWALIKEPLGSIKGREFLTIFFLESVADIKE
jgi:hypothetical protein